MINKILPMLCLVLCATFPSAKTIADDVTDVEAAAQTTESSADLTAIRAGSQAFVNAFNSQDAKALASLWTKDGEFIDDQGNRYAGREAIANAYAELFADVPNLRIRIVIDSLRMVSSTVAIEDGRAIADPAPSGAAGVSKYTAIHVKEAGKWLMASVRDTWVEAATTPNSIADLGWLVGTWTAEEHGRKIDSVFRWVANKSFLERAFTTTLVDGTSISGVQLIGWNPLAEAVQSWSFSPDGGHATGIWSPTSTGWVSESSGVTGEGLLTRTVNRFTKLDENAIAWQSTERTVDGVSIPDTDEVVIKRKSSQPTAP